MSEQITDRYLPYEGFFCQLCDYDECQKCVRDRYDTMCLCGGPMILSPTKRSPGVSCDGCGTTGWLDGFSHCGRGCNYDLCRDCHTKQSCGRNKPILFCPKGHVCEMRKMDQVSRSAIPPEYASLGNVSCDECRDHISDQISSNHIMFGSGTYFHCGICKYDRCDTCALRVMAREDEE